MFRWTVKVDVGPRNIFKDAAGAAVDHHLYVFWRYMYDRGSETVAEIVALDFNTVSLRWRELSSVKTGKVHSEIRKTRRCRGHTAVAIGRLVYVWGGPPPYHILHVFDVDADKWSVPETSGMSPRAVGQLGHSACALQDSMFIYGGQRTTGDNYDNYMFKLDTVTMVWSEIRTRGTKPSPYRSSFNAVAVVGTKIFVFTSAEDFGVFVFDTETNLWTGAPVREDPSRGPTLKWHQSAFSYDGQLYVAAVGNSREDLARTPKSSYLWRFDPTTRSRTRVEPKGSGPAHLRGTRCCVVAGERVVFFDGVDYFPRELCILDLRPSLKTLCKDAFIRHSLERSELPHGVRWELAAMTETDPEARVLR